MSFLYVFGSQKPPGSSKCLKAITLFIYTYYYILEVEVSHSSLA